MNRTQRNAVLQTLAVLLTLYCTVSMAQVDTGTPPFQSFGGGPDIINLGNLNVHYSIPVFSRPGRSISFNYPLAYDSSVWKLSGSAWVPASATWGLNKHLKERHGPE